ncbi:TetR/AcrR family transcriptional regulator [Rouxiella badensis]|uniref:TetR/AcrR family transcriptional regulator n=1 Tax=Rouxiella badensis TaxID=1646377 RepID=UPI0017888BC7|nr:TetR/AcrR family transcriptional regulator [Rouxiella badensis]QOI55848.1 TetR/AcrR family transcriptional regulator [Rouxiella badensis subsp. acadiensis]
MNTRSSPTVAQPAARERILHTAHDLFYRDGIRATGIDSIIREAGVTKVTFYRHYPSKDALILAFLQYRHQRWISWFSQALREHSDTGMPLPAALAATLQAWFEREDFRGCAFINSSLEYGDALPEVLKLSVAHKKEMAEVIADYFKAFSDKNQTAESVALLIDGAIIKAQMENEATQATQLVQKMLTLLLSARMTNY